MVGMRCDECHTAQCTVRCHQRMGDMQAPAGGHAAAENAPESADKAPGGASNGSPGATPTSKTADVDREPVYAKVKQVQHLLVQLSRCAKEGLMVLPPKQLEQVSAQHLPAMYSAWRQADLTPVYQLPAALREAGRAGLCLPEQSRPCCWCCCMLRVGSQRCLCLWEETNNNLWAADSGPESVRCTCRLEMFIISLCIAHDLIR